MFNQSVFRNVYESQYGNVSLHKMCNSVRSSRSYLQRLQLEKKLAVHNGCVNSVIWNDTGTLLLSGSDDTKLVITNPFTDKVLDRITSGHKANIFSAKFLPNSSDRHIISCSGDGSVLFTNVDRISSTNENVFHCHYGTAYEIITVPQDSHTFLSCGEDCTVRWFDLRIKDKCSVGDCKEDILINCRRPVTALAINPMMPYQLSVGCSDSTVRIYDRRMLGTRATGNYTGRGISGLVSRFQAPNLESTSHRITSLTYSNDGAEMLVSYSSEHLYLFDLKEEVPKQQFSTTPVKSETENDIDLSSDVSNQTTADNCQKLNSPGDDTSKKTSPLKTSHSTSDLNDAVSGNENQMQSSLSCDDIDTSDSLQRYPPIKRLRLRGDWSDTGPNARPERERADSDGANFTIIQRWLSRWLGTSALNQTSAQSNTEVSAPAIVNPFETENNPSVPVNETDREHNIQTALPNTEGVLENNAPVQSSTCDKNVIADNSIAMDYNEITDLNSSIGTTSDNDTVSQIKLNCSSDSNNKVACDSPSTSTFPGEQSNIDKDMNFREIPYMDWSNVNNLNKDSNSDAFPTNYTSIKETMESRNVEPVINLEYRSEGTSASTIEVNYASIDDRDSISNISPQICSNISNVSQSVKIAHKNSEKNTENINTSQSVQTSSSSALESQSFAPLVESHAQSDETSVTSTPPSSGIPENLRMLYIIPPPDFMPESVHDVFRAFTNSTSVGNSNSRIASDSENPPTTSDECDYEMDGPTRPEKSSSSKSQTGSHLLEEKNRRIGLSGPSSTPSQPINNDSDSQSSNSPSRPPTNRFRDRLGNIDENLAAYRLQELYRRKQEEREKEEVISRNIFQPAVKQVYRGHRNARTMIKEATFWGDDYVMSGSDCGHIFVWDRYSAEVVMMMEADKHVVNCLQPHPFYPILASSGIDYNIKLWTPSSSNLEYNMDAANEIIRRNEIMLEETRDTITVPASFMLRMLRSLNHMRSVSQAAQRENNEDDDSSSSDD